MKAKRLFVIGLVLAGIALILVLVRFFPSSEPTYDGKSVSVWFREYAFGSNSFAASSYSFSTNGSNLIIRTSSGVLTVQNPALTNRSQQLRWVQSVATAFGQQRSDPAWLALQALGSNAVPHLVRQLHIGPLDRTYERAVTNLPVALQRKLPSPALKRFFRIQALRAIARLGDVAREATPALLELFKQRDPAVRREVTYALHHIHAGRQAINNLLLELGAQKRYVELTEMAWETGWDGGELTQLFGQILRSPDPALRRNAIRLLERVGRDAALALEPVTAALKDSDSEVRYLAARSLEYIGTDTPAVTGALRTSLEDDSVMVRTVAHRTLKKIAPEMIPSAQPAGAAKD